MSPRPTIIALAALAGLATGALVALVLDSGSKVDTTGEPSGSANETSVEPAEEIERPEERPPESISGTAQPVDDETADESEPVAEAPSSVPVDAQAIRAAVEPHLVTLEGAACRAGGSLTGLAVAGHVVAPAVAAIYTPMLFATHTDGTVERLDHWAPIADGSLVAFLSSAPGLSAASTDVPAAGDEALTIERSGATTSTATGSIVAVNADQLEIGLEPDSTAPPGSVVGVGTGTGPYSVVTASESNQLSATMLFDADLALSASSYLTTGTTCDSAIPPNPFADWMSPGVAELRSFLLAQALASALADRDLDLVRQLDARRPNLSAGDLAAGWGNLRESTLVPTRSETISASVTRWRVGLVAHEVSDTGDVTKVFCVTWDADTANGNVFQTGADSLLISEDPGWTDPAALYDFITAACV